MGGIHEAQLALAHVHIQIAVIVASRKDRTWTGSTLPSGEVRSCSMVEAATVVHMQSTGLEKIAAR